MSNRRRVRKTPRARVRTFVITHFRDHARRTTVVRTLALRTPRADKKPGVVTGLLSLRKHIGSRRRF
jgi:hypothetical protein